MKETISKNHEYHIFHPIVPQCTCEVSRLITIHSASPKSSCDPRGHTSHLLRACRIRKNLGVSGAGKNRIPVIFNEKLYCQRTIFPTNSCLLMFVRPLRVFESGSKLVPGKVHMIKAEKFLWSIRFRTTPAFPPDSVSAGFGGDAGEPPVAGEPPGTFTTPWEGLLPDQLELQGRSWILVLFWEWELESSELELPLQ